MIPARGTSAAKSRTIHSSSSRWLRAPAGGLLRTYKNVGEEVAVGDLLGVVSDPFGEVETEILVEFAGLLIGRTNLPIVNEGDGLFHIAQIKPDRNAADAIDALTVELNDDVPMDEDEII